MMLGSVRALRTTVSPLTAGIFLLGLLMAAVGSAHASEPVEPHDTPAQHHEAGHHHPGDHHDPADPAAPDHDGHGCDVCICYAAAGSCSAPALSGEISAPAEAPVVLPRGLAAPAAPPGSSPPHDIFHPPQG
jgi:hypothetical protein